MKRVHHENYTYVFNALKSSSLGDGDLRGLPPQWRLWSSLHHWHWHCRELPKWPFCSFDHDLVDPSKMWHQGQVKIHLTTLFTVRSSTLCWSRAFSISWSSLAVSMKFGPRSLAIVFGYPRQLDMHIKHLKELEHKRFWDWLSYRCDSLESKFCSTMEFVSFIVSVGPKWLLLSLLFSSLGLETTAFTKSLSK